MLRIHVWTASPCLHVCAFKLYVCSASVDVHVCVYWSISLSVLWAVNCAELLEYSYHNGRRRRSWDRNKLMEKHLSAFSLSRKCILIALAIFLSGQFSTVLSENQDTIDKNVWVLLHTESWKSLEPLEQLFLDPPFFTIPTRTARRKRYADSVMYYSDYYTQPHHYVIFCLKYKWLYRWIMEKTHWKRTNGTTSPLQPFTHLSGRINTDKRLISYHWVNDKPLCPTMYVKQHIDSRLMEIGSYMFATTQLSICFDGLPPFCWTCLYF